MISGITTNAPIVSMTHHRFARPHPLAREIASYCWQRIMRIKKLHGRMAVI